MLPLPLLLVLLLLLLLPQLRVRVCLRGRVVGEGQKPWPGYGCKSAGWGSYVALAWTEMMCPPSLDVRCPVTASELLQREEGCKG